MKSLKIIPFIIGLSLSTAAMAQARPPCSSSHFDVDGDGWGWENGQTCVSPVSGSSPVNTNSNTACVDPDGDGWGWNGTSSCEVNASTPGKNSDGGGESPKSTNCVDSDGDGWGWNGTSSCKVEGQVAAKTDESQPTSEAECVDTPPFNNGWGWNGTTSCRISVSGSSTDDFVPKVAAAKASPLARNGKLSVCNKNGFYSLCNQYGNQVQLTGMSSHGIQWSGWSKYDQGGCLTESSLDLLADTWNTDIFRIAMYVEQGGYNSDPETFILHVNELIAELEERGMYAIVDFHILSGRNISGRPLDYLKEAETFFRRIVRDNKHRKNVLYEIANEPQGSNLTWDEIRQYGDIITRVIRQEEDPKNNAVVIMGTNSWSSFGIANNGSFWDIVDNPVTDSANNLMYTFHFYANDPSHIRNNYRGELNESVHHIPVFVTEWGTQHASGGGANDFNIANEYVQVMKNKKISWTMWNFSDTLEESAVWNNTSFCGKDSGWQDESNLSETGLFIKGVFDSN